jgi:hypothetical protein
MKVARLGRPPSRLSRQPQGSTSPETLDEKTRAMDRLGSKAGVCPQRDNGKIKISSVARRNFCKRTSSPYDKTIEKIPENFKVAPDPTGRFPASTLLSSKDGFQSLFH